MSIENWLNALMISGSSNQEDLSILSPIYSPGECAEPMLVIAGNLVAEINLVVMTKNMYVDP